MFVSQPKSVEVKCGETVEFQVQAKGEPAPVLTWYKDDRKLEFNDRISEKVENNIHKISIKNIVASDRGYYDCLAENVHGKNCTRAFLNIHIEKPVEEVQPASAPAPQKPPTVKNLVKKSEGNKVTTEQAKPAETSVPAPPPTPAPEPEPVPVVPVVTEQAKPTETSEPASAPEPAPAPEPVQEPVATPEPAPVAEPEQVAAPVPQPEPVEAQVEQAQPVEITTEVPQQPIEVTEEPVKAEENKVELNETNESAQPVAQNEQQEVPETTNQPNTNEQSTLTTQPNETMQVLEEPVVVATENAQ